MTGHGASASRPPPSPSSRGHLIIVAILSGLLISAVQGSFFEWAFHRYWLHRPWLPESCFTSHTLVHHQLCKFEDTFQVVEEEQEEALTFQWWGGPSLVLLNTAVWALISWGLSALGVSFPFVWLVVGFGVGMSLYYLGYEGLHHLMHKPSVPLIEKRMVRLEIVHQGSTMRAALKGGSKRVEFQADAAQLEVIPQTLEHDDEFCIDIRTAETKRLDIDLVKLPISATLRSLMTKHRSDREYPLRAVVEEVVFHRCTDDSSRELRTHGQFVAIESVGETEHFLFDNVGDLANAAAKQGRLLQYGGAHVAISVTVKPAMQMAFEGLPENAIDRYDIVHALDPGQFQRGS